MMMRLHIGLCVGHVYADGLVFNEHEHSSSDKANDADDNVNTEEPEDTFSALVSEGSDDERSLAYYSTEPSAIYESDMEDMYE